MSRAYTVATVAVTLGVDSKWVDNILSRFVIRGVMQSRQGVSRRISPDGVLQLSVIQGLTNALRIPVELAVERSHILLGSEEYLIGAGLSLHLNKGEQLAELEARLEYAVETTPVPRRGRPPGKTKRGAS
jgi:hypothetical protein